MTQPATLGPHFRLGLPQPTPSGDATRQSFHGRRRRPRHNVKALVEHALTILQTTSSLVAGAAGDLAVPGLGIGLTALAEFLKKLQTMKANIQGVDVLVAHIAALSTEITAFYSRHRDQPLPEAMRRRIEQTIRLWSVLAEQAQRLKSPGTIKRFFTGDAAAKILDSLVQDVSRSIQEFLFSGLLNVEEIVHCVHEDTVAIRQDAEAARQDAQFIREGVSTVCEDARTLFKGVESAHEDLIRLQQDVKDIKTRCDDSIVLAYAKNAPYDASDARRSCLPGTRVELLKQFCDWVAMAISHRDLVLSINPGNVFWICGMAGTGKTTLAFSIAQLCREEGVLGASFFCSRFDAGCSDPRLVFATISQQLCCFHLPFKEKVAAIVKKDPTVTTANTELQFEALVLRPLEELEGTFPLSVIVLDALDECRHTGNTSTILGVIAKYAHRVAGHILFIVTSRPERSITALFEATEKNAFSLRDATTLLLLDTIESTSLSADIRLYLEDGFEEIRRIYRLSDWPSSGALDQLVMLSGGLFIWAATALRFIGDMGYYSDPRAQLESLLGKLQASHASNSILNTLYCEIANSAFTNISASYSKRLRPLLGALALAQEPLSVVALAGLVQMDESMVRLVLIRLHSVLHIPEDGRKPIRAIHPTFAEFLLNSLIAKPHVFRIDPTIQNFVLFCQCMAAIDGLERNIAGISKPSLFYDEIPRLADTVRKRIPAHTAYACRYWGAHMEGCASGGAQSIYDSLRRFLDGNLLYWIEACSLLRILGDASAALAAAKRACEVLGGPFMHLVPLLTDCQHFLLEFSPVVHMAPLQLYHSALALAPAENLVKKTYAKELNPSRSLLVSRGAPTHQSSCLDVLRGHEGWVLSLAFSPHGDYFATGCSNGKITLWTTATRTVHRYLYGHTGWVTCVAFSPNGVYLASGSDDNTVRIWNLSSGDYVHTLDHTTQVDFVAYSKDGTRLLSSTSSGQIKLWHTTTWSCIFASGESFNRTRIVNSVSFSPDGHLIARGMGTSVRLYDVSSDTHSTLDLPGETQAALFSPNGRYVAARTDRTVLVWECTDQSLVTSIDTPHELSGPLIFSPDCARIGCGSVDGSVLLWRPQSADPPQAYGGYGDRIRGLSWSPDGFKVICATGRYTIRVWDVRKPQIHEASNELSVAPPTPSRPLQFALIHNDRNVIAILHLSSLPIDAGPFASTPITPDGAPAVMFFEDMVDACDSALKISRRLQLSAEWYSPEWAFITGDRSVAFDWQPVAISPDGSRLAYRSSTTDTIVEVCNLHTAAKTATLLGHTGCIRSLAFSSDGVRLVTGSDDEAIKVWDATTGTFICGHDEHRSWVLTSKFSSDGRLVASGSGDGDMIIFEIATARVIRNHSHRDSVLEVMFVADDTRVVSLDDSHRVYVWDVQTGARVCEVSLGNIESLRAIPESATVDATGTHGAGTRTVWRQDNPIQHLYEASRKGWLTAKSVGRMAKVCWLPPEWREFIALEGAQICCLDRERRKAAVVDVSSLPDYVQEWGSGTE